jgi:integral membrane protein
MPLGPRKADVPRIRRTLAVYKVSSVITGTFLLLLCLMMVLRYGVGVDIELGGAYGFLALTPKELITGVNLSMFILIVHGWLYVLYLACDFLLWRYLRWSFGRFLFIALGGVVPLLSFFLERRVPRLAEERMRPLTADAPDLVETRS